MTRISTLLCTVALTFAFGVGAVTAQTPAPAPTPAAKATPKKSEFKLKTATTAAGKECSDQAEAKGLHGKERRKFRNACKKEMKAKGAPKA